MDNKVMSQQIFYLISSLIGLIFFVLISFRVEAGPADYQRCKIDSSCIIGEFLYDDNYNPITTANCTLTTRDPGGSVFINSASMSASTDGWYSYNVETTGQTEGLYRSQMCCTATPDYLCLDKSFYIGPSFLSSSEVGSAVWNATTSAHVTPGSFGRNLQKPVLSASEIWGYTDRTLSGFGTLIADIWSYSTRSLTGFGTLIADIWKNDTRTLTGPALNNSQELATKETVEKTAYSAFASVNNSVNKNVTDVLSFGENSVIFDLTVKNPSALVGQSIAFTYYLPSEVKKEEIINIDKDLKTEISTVDNILLVTGETQLNASQEKTFKVEVKDIWNIDRDKIDSLRAQADELFGPLKKTSYYGQGATLKSDIDANLDRVLIIQKDVETPQLKIKAYRIAMVEFNSAKSKINDLKTLVAQAGSAKSLFGFIGGVQIASVWGLILVFIAGFVFMILFMKSQEKKHTADPHAKQFETITENRFFDFFHRHKIKTLIIVGIVLSGILLSSLFSQDGNKKLAIAQKSIEKIKITLAPTPTIAPTVAPSPVVLGLTTKNKIFAVVPSDSSVRIRAKPLLQSETVYVLKATATVNRLDEIPDWVKIEIPEDKISSESAIIGWIAKEFTQEVPE